MRYRRPFDPRQRAAAAAVYRRYRQNLNELRQKFPPGNLRERSMLRAYRGAIENFARELLLPDAKLNAERLNELERHATHAGVDYIIERSGRTGFGPD